MALLAINKSKVLKILYKSIRFMRDNGYILDKFCYKDFNLLSIALEFRGIAYANSVYNEEFCLLIIFYLLIILDEIYVTWLVSSSENE